MMPPSINPKVAHASASSLADAIPYFSEKTAPHAAPVPCPPGQRDRSRKESDQRFQAQQLRQREADEILGNEEGNDHKKQFDQRTSAPAQTRKVSVEADAGKEHQHQRRTQTAVETDLKPGARMQGVERQCHDQSADNRFRNRIGPQRLDPLDELAAGQQHQGGNDQRAVNVQ